MSAWHTEAYKAVSRRERQGRDDQYNMKVMMNKMEWKLMWSEAEGTGGEYSFELSIHWRKKKKKKKKSSRRKNLNSWVLIFRSKRCTAKLWFGMTGPPPGQAWTMSLLCLISVGTVLHRRLITSGTKGTCPICLYIWSGIFKEAKPHFHACLLFTVSAYRNRAVATAPSSLPQALRMLDVSTANLGKYESLLTVTAGILCPWGNILFIIS